MSRADELHQDIARQEPRLGRGRSFDRAADERAARDGGRFQQRLHVETDPASMHPAIPHERLRDFLCEVAGIAPASPMLISLTPTISPGMLTSGPPELPPKIARVVADPAHDRSHVLPVERHAIERPEHARHDHFGIADDAHRDGLRQGERAAERHDAVADLQPSTHRQSCATGKVRGFAGFSLRMAMSDNGSVPTSSAGISSRVASVQMMDARPAGDVMVGEDVPFRRDDRAAARCLALQFPAFLGTHT